MQVILREFNGTIIRRCDTSDIISVMEINMKTLPEHYSDYFYESLLADLPESFLIAENGEISVGYIMCKSEFGFSNFKKLGFVKKGHVVSVAVLEEQRGNGYGKILVNEAFKGVKEKQCDEMYLEVRCSNTEAVKLYQDLGMDIKQRLKSYYRDGEDAYMMAIEFS